MRGIGPLSLLAGCLLPVAGALAVTDVEVGLLLIAAQALSLGWLIRNPRGTVARLGVGLVAACTLALSTWLYAGHDVDLSAAAALRVMCIVLPAAILSPSIRPDTLGDHLAQRLHLPARSVAAAVAALQRVDQLGEQWHLVQQARRARGLGADGGPMRRVRAMGGGAFALLVASMRQTSQLAMAMDARGFATAQRRTWALPAPWLPGDWLVLTLSMSLATLPWLL